MGAAILAAAQNNNTQSVKPRLEAFTAVHRRCASAQRKVEAIDERIQAAQDRLAASDTAQDAAIEGLARALVADGQPRSNPFAAFGAPAVDDGAPGLYRALFGRSTRPTRKKPQPAPPSEPCSCRTRRSPPLLDRLYASRALCVPQGYCQPGR